METPLRPSSRASSRVRSHGIDPNSPRSKAVLRVGILKFAKKHHFSLKYAIVIQFASSE